MAATTKAKAAAISDIASTGLTCVSYSSIALLMSVMVAIGPVNCA